MCLWPARVAHTWRLRRAWAIRALTVATSDPIIQGPAARTCGIAPFASGRRMTADAMRRPCVHGASHDPHKLTVRGSRRRSGMIVGPDSDQGPVALTSLVSAGSALSASALEANLSRRTVLRR